MSCNFNQAYNLTANGFTRTGYTFSGWATSPSGSKVYGNGASVNNLGLRAGDIVTLYAVWTNNSANYTVKHMLQNSTGTGYDLDHSYTQSAEIGSSVTPEVLTYKGFTSPSTQTKQVAANGSTVIEYKYDRNKHKLTLTKGNGIDAVYTSGDYLYGQTVTIDADVSDYYKWSKWST